MEEIVNRVAASSLVTFDLDSLYRSGERVEFDIKPALEQGLLLRERTFREFVGAIDAETYRGKLVALTCSSDALIPAWAWMLVVAVLEPVAVRVVQGDLMRLEERLFFDALASVDWETYRGARVLVKGCSQAEVPASVFAEVTARLRPLALSIMYGEACSSVPVFKKKQENTSARP